MYVYNVITGVIIPQTQNVLTEVTDEFLEAFGDDLITSPDTPQGALITAETAARTNVINNNAQVANNINPNLAGGVFLDAIGALTLLPRSLQTFSSVEISLTGVPFTSIPTSVIIADENGNEYQNSTLVTLNSGGTATSQFIAVVPGPIITPATTTWVFITGILGLESVSNAAGSSPGVVTQSDQSYKKQRQNTLALQGTALPEAIKSALYALDPTVNLSFQENISASTVVINGVTMLPHSIYVCVSDAGFVIAPYTPLISDLQVATVLLSKKSAGAAWNNSGSAGSKSVPVVEPVSGQTYTVLFDRPLLVPIDIQVTYTVYGAPANVTSIITAAINTYIAGQLNNEPGFSVFNNVSCFELAGAINQTAPSIFLRDVSTKLHSAMTFSNALILIPINSQAVLGTISFVPV